MNTNKFNNFLLVSAQDSHARSLRFKGTKVIWRVLPFPTSEKLTNPPRIMSWKGINQINRLDLV